MFLGTKQTLLFFSSRRNSLQDRLQSKRSDCDVMHGKDLEEPKESSYLKNRIALPYGDLGLAKLIEELGSEDPEMQTKVINTLADGVIINPILGQTTINALDFVRKLSNAFLHQRYKYQKSSEESMDALLEIFMSIAMHMNGSQYILKTERLVKALYEMIENDEENGSKAAEILAFATKEYDDVFHLQEHYNAIYRLARSFRRKERASSHSPALHRHLQWLLEIFPDVGVKEGFFEILFKRIEDRVCNFHKYDLKSFGLLLRCPDGQKRFVAIDGIKKIYDILVDSERILDSYENVVYTIMTGLFSKEVLLRCSEFVDLPEHITELAKDSKETVMQLYCFQVLYALADMLSIKRLMRTNCYEILQQTNCEAKANEKRKSELLYKLSREIYHTSGLRLEVRKPLDIDVETKPSSFGAGRHVKLRRLSVAQSMRGDCDVVHGEERKACESRYFKDRATLAYGMGALPKLMEDMGSEDPQIQLQSMNSLAELLLNPLHGQSAINAHEVVKRQERCA
uniref:Uncharacterized protein n=1 Tax=Glossina brevipalpis TaxID=37001 RepID=A0A1A9W7R3_9MUSC